MGSVVNFLEETDLSTGSFYMCYYSTEVRSSEATRWLSNVSQIHNLGFQGRISLNEKGEYVGPMPRSCGHQAHDGPADGSGPEVRAGAWPEELCAKI